MSLMCHIIDIIINVINYILILLLIMVLIQANIYIYKYKKIDNW